MKITRRLLAAPAALALALVAGATAQPTSASAQGPTDRVTMCVANGYSRAKEKTRRVSLENVATLLGSSRSYLGHCAVYGAPKRIGNGTLRTFAQMDRGRPEVIGVTLDQTALTGLPTEMSDGKRCFDVDGDGTIDPMMECVGGHQRILQLPRELKRLPGNPFKWVLFNWNPMGHGPVYNVAHLDAHFYIQPKSQRDKIRLGPCGVVVNCDDFSTGTIPVPPQYLPQDYSDNGAVEAFMGNHLVDKSNPEWHGAPFVKTLIYGSYAGKISFIEPMITTQWLEDISSGAESSACYPIKQPSAWQVRGWYPRSYCTRFIPNRSEYQVTLENFQRSGGCHEESAVGRWSTTVVAQGKPPSEATIVFHANGSLTIIGPSDVNGRPLYVGTGTWTQAVGGRFAFDVVHPLPDGQGGVIGVLRGHQEGTFTDHQFFTTGQAYVDKPDGSTLGPNPVSMTGLR